MALVSPSLLAADFLHLDRDIEMINRSEADWLHLDVMYGVFVPNISFGFPVLEAVASLCKKPLDVHYMIVKPERYIRQTAKLGAMMMNVHLEACDHLHRTVQEIHVRRTEIYREHAEESPPTAPAHQRERQQGTD